MPTVLIAGANRGIGLEFVRQYAADGWAVIAGCRRPDEAADLQALARDGAVEVHAVDTASDTEVGAFKGAVGDRPLDLVIANAGAALRSNAPGTINNKCFFIFSPFWSPARWPRRPPTGPVLQ